jgi:DNA-binding transcriptional LysR family regulator
MLGNLSGADLRALHVFVTVAECGGFSSAQVVLNVSQPTISVQITNLERRLGFRLCERGRTGFRLTQRGGAVLNQAKTLFGSVKEFRSEINSLAGRLMGELHVGLLDTIISNGQAQVPRAIAEFRNRNQEVALSLTVGSPVELERAVIDDRMHLAIGYFGRRL